MPDENPALWGASSTYERYMGRWGRKIAPQFLDWLAAPIDKSWIDVGCGTGGLTQLIDERQKPSRLFGIDTSEGFVAAAKKSVPDAVFSVGSAMNIEMADNSVDFAVSGLVLNFLPDQPAAIAEMVRVVDKGGSVALYVWDYSGHMQIMRYFFDAARQIDAGSAEFDDGINAPICKPEALMENFAAAGMLNVETTAIDIATAFDDFEDYWQPFMGGTGSAPKYLVAQSPAIQSEIKEAVRLKLPTASDGKILLAARAWAVKGNVG